MDKFDVAVIGGGPAGSFAAFLLAAGGLSVCVFEKKLFPRETLCGEFLSYEVSKHLKDAGLFERLLQLNPNRITSFSLFTPNEKIHTNLKFTAYGLKRSTLDDFLLREAKGKGVTVYQPYSVSHIKKTDKDFVLSADSLNEGKEVRAEIVVNASGKRSTVDKILDRSFPGINSPYNGVKIHLQKDLFRKLNINEIQIYTGKNLYCGVNKVEGDLVTVCFLEKRGVNDPSVRAKFLSLREENPSFGELLSEKADKVIKSARVYGAGNIYFGKKEAVKDDIYMVGDSAGMIAPLAGDGIGMAIESAKLFSELFLKQREDKKTDKDIQELYTTEWNRKFRRRILTAGLIQKVMFSSMLNPGLKLLSIYPSSINTLIDYTRK